jgi:hypothetical protein
MLELAATTDKLQLTTSSTSAIDVHVSYVDHTLSGDNVEGNRQNTAITTATTTDILAAPASGVVRMVEVMTIRNKGTANNDVTVIFDANGTDYELHKVTLRPEEQLQYMPNLGFFVRLPSKWALPMERDNAARGSAGDILRAGANAEVITGSEIHVPNAAALRVGTLFKWTGSWAKTAAGTAAISLVTRTGTMPTPSGSTARNTLTLSASTAAADNGSFDVSAVVRAVGGSGTIHAVGVFRHHLSTTGLHTLDHQVVQNVSATFDNTTSDLLVGLGLTPGTANIVTVHSISKEAYYPP